MTGQYATFGPKTEPFSADRFQVLALDGGGAKALFTAHLLARFEKDHNVRIVDCFDLIAGTSAGGIIALALGAGLSPAEIADRYVELVAKVFPKSRRRHWAHRARRPAYSGKVLHETLTDVLGDRLLGQSEKRLIIPSWDVQNGQVHYFKTPHHDRLVRDWCVRMVDVALATSAAPTYFPAAVVDDARLIDGGVFANNPSIVAIAEAFSMLGVTRDQICVLNIGTMDEFTYHPDRLDNGGLAQWSRAVIPLITTAASTSTTGLAQHLIGFENFTRMNVTVPPKMFALDRIDAAKIAGYASTVSRNLSPVFVDKFADHTAAPYAPPPGRGGQEHIIEETH